MESSIRTRYHYWLNRQVRQPKTSLARQQGGPAGGYKLEVSLDGEPSAASSQHAAAPEPVVKSAADSTLDDEMSKLLSDLAGKR